jgi:dihydrofolate reductase
MTQPFQIDLYAAISLDGYIARPDKTTDWTKDAEQFETLCREYQGIVMGRETYDEFEGPAFEGIENLVLTHNPEEYSDRQGVHFVSTPAQAIELAREFSFDKLLVIGGAQTYASFVEHNVPFGLKLDIHPIFLGEGLKLFGESNQKLQLEIRDAEQQDGYLHVTYTVRT